MKIIDVHAHIYPPKIEAKAVNAIREFYDRPFMSHKGAADALIKAGNEAGLTNYLVFSTATTPHQVESINNFIIETVSEYKQFIGAGTVHVDYDNCVPELHRIYEAGLRGIKFHPDFQKFNFDDERLYPSYEAMQELGMFVITHSGDPRYPFSRPERVARVAKDFPKLKIIAAHFGGWSMWDLGIKCLAHLENIYVDTSSTYGFVGTKQVKESIDAFDKSHIFFGCDYPMWDYKDEIKMLESLNLDQKLFEDILFNNFAKFYEEVSIGLDHNPLRDDG